MTVTIVIYQDGSDFSTPNAYPALHITMRNNVQIIEFTIPCKNPVDSLSVPIMKDHIHRTIVDFVQRWICSWVTFEDFSWFQATIMIEIDKEDIRSFKVLGCFFQSASEFRSIKIRKLDQSILCLSPTKAHCFRRGCHKHPHFMDS